LSIHIGLFILTKSTFCYHCYHINVSIQTLDLVEKGKKRPWSLFFNQTHDCIWVRAKISLTSTFTWLNTISFLCFQIHQMMDTHTPFHNLLLSLLSQGQWNCSKCSFRAKWFTYLTPVHLLQQFHTTLTIWQVKKRCEDISSSVPHKTHDEFARWTDLLIRFCFVAMLFCNAVQTKHCVDGGNNKPRRTLYISLSALGIELETIAYADLTKYLQICGSLHNHLSSLPVFKVWPSSTVINSSTWVFSHSNHSLLHLNSQTNCLYSIYQSDSGDYLWWKGY